MKKGKLKLLPPIVMLLAGSITAILTYYFKYEIKAALIILLSVLLVFYFIGSIFAGIVFSFNKAIWEEEQKKKEEEGLVVEIEADGMDALEKEQGDGGREEGTREGA
ncbi:MAG: hypothetical protein IJC59_05890 [Lachnospiraceae bacterium]|nr:hypothetical protein [Lachnospiraceae bacterium]